MKYIGDYDSLGRLSKEEVQNSSNSEYIGSSEYGYDVRNNLTNLITNYGGKYRNQRYYYSAVNESSSSAKYAKDNLPTMYKLYASRYALYKYDDINRLTQRELTTDKHLFYNYTYRSSLRNVEGETKYTTSQIQDEKHNQGTVL